MISNETPKIQGIIHISHSVDCPHCNETMYDDLDREWWDKNITDQLPKKEAYEDVYKVNCKDCDKPFIIDSWAC